jgi:hypothetical protein
MTMLQSVGVTCGEVEGMTLTSEHGPGSIIQVNLTEENLIRIYEI